MRSTILICLFCGLTLFSACDKGTTPNKENVIPEKNVVPEPKKVNPADGEAVKTALDNLFEVAKTADCAKLAGMLVCKDGPEDQVWKRTLRYDLAAEKLTADKECAILQVLTTDLQSHVFKEFSQEDSKEGQWNVWVVHLVYGDGSEEDKAFGFLKIGGQYALGDID